MIIDSDSHVMEPTNLWETYIDPKFRDLALSISHLEEASDDLLARRPYLVYKGRFLFPVCGSTPTGLGNVHELANASRDHESYAITRQRLLNIRESLFSYDDQTPAAGYDGSNRLKWMEAHSIDRAVILPTWGAMWERYLDDQPIAIAANMSAYNRWMLDFCSADPKRLVGIGQITPNNIEWSIAELRSLAKKGIRAIQIRPVLFGGLPLSHGSFDRFWKTLVELDLAVYFHVSGMGSGPRDFFDSGWYTGEDRGQHNGVIWGVSTHIPLMLTLTAMVRDKFFDRYPSIRICSAEHGYRWFAPWLAELDSDWELMIARNFVKHSKQFDRPSQAIRSHVWFAGIHDELAIAQHDGMLERVMFGTDFPHPECANEPLADFYENSRQLSPQEQTQVLTSNCEEFLGERAIQ